jgi:hypothetical protein
MAELGEQDDSSSPSTSAVGLNPLENSQVTAALCNDLYFQ